MNCRQLSPEEIGQAMLATLENAAKDRNDLVVRTNDAHGKIGVTRQTDDPKKPGILKIDVDAPAPEHGEAKDVFLARLEIDLNTGEMKYFPAGYPSQMEIHPLSAHHEILEQMCETIWNN